MKTGFRAKDAKNAKKLLQGELVEFVYESFDVTFEERAINHRCSGTILIHPRNLCVLCVLSASSFSFSEIFQHQTRLYRYAKFKGNFVPVALRVMRP